MSVRDKGGRSAWQSYNGGSSSSAGPSSSAFNTGTSHAAEAPAGGIPSHHGTTDYGYAKKTTGYVPARTPSPMAPSPTIPVSPATTALPSYSAAASSSTQLDSSSQTSLPLTSVSRVRALHNFEGTEQGELTFEKGDIIKVVDRNYKDWWRGQLKGRTGIFPVNYVVSREISMRWVVRCLNMFLLLRSFCRILHRRKSRGRLSTRQPSLLKRRILTSY